MTSDFSSAVPASTAFEESVAAADRDTPNNKPLEPELLALAEQLTGSEQTGGGASGSWALFVGIGLLMIGNGLHGTLLGIRSEIEGFSGIATGLIMTSYFVGFLAGSKAAIRALAMVGHIRVFSALASMASAATLVHLVTITPITWSLMRFTTGLCMAGLYVVVESWINEMATNATRGKLLALYMAVTMGGVAVGQFLLNLADPAGFELFVVASVLVSLALVPVSLSGGGAPPIRTPVPMSIRQMAKIVPTGLAVASLIGMANGALLGMGAVYATRAGLTPGQIALFMGAPMVGGVVLQFPIGALSDRVPRRGVMLGVAIGASICATALLFAPPASITSYLLMFGVGGFSFPLYSLGIAYTNDWISPEQTMGASSTLVTANGLGAVIGPLASAGLIVFLGNRMFFVVLIVTHGAIAAYLAFRIVARDGLPLAKQGRFLPVPARASAMAVGKLAKRRRPR